MSDLKFQQKNELTSFSSLQTQMPISNNSNQSVNKIKTSINGSTFNYNAPVDNNNSNTNYGVSFKNTNNADMNSNVNGNMNVRVNNEINKNNGISIGDKIQSEFKHHFTNNQINNGCSVNNIGNKIELVSNNHSGNDSNSKKVTWKTNPVTVVEVSSFKAYNIPNQITPLFTAQLCDKKDNTKCSCIIF